MIPTTQLEFKTAGRKRQHWMISEAQYATPLCREMSLSNPNLTTLFLILCLSVTYSFRQGGRTCTGARVAPAEKFGLGRKF